VASINVLANPVRRVNPDPLTIALTVPSLSETLWIHPQKARLTLLATRSRISLSTRGLCTDLRFYTPTSNMRKLSYPFDVFMLLLDYPWSVYAFRHETQILVLSIKVSVALVDLSTTWRSGTNSSLQPGKHDSSTMLDRQMCYFPRWPATLDAFNTLTKSLACVRLHFLLCCVLLLTNEARGKEALVSCTQQNRH